ncbi:MAG: UMF1 family MFS transporter [Saprospiraceae bacterium]|jgi:UMF1 family MFS transporter|tara:strand:- start:3246 stop:4541 length:1296 start_codon:yes stop_codon:yes gene_type:complete
MAEIIKNVKRTINAWALFDWANSAYALVISTAIFPVYFIKNTPDLIDLGGYTFTNTSLYSFAVAFSYILIALLSPILSGIADYTGRRMFFLKMFTFMGSLACMAMWFFSGEDQLWLGTSAFILATIGFTGGLVFYNSYLPLIVTEDRYEKVSAKGFAAGYIGSVILLLIILSMVLSPDTYGIEDSRMPARIGFVMVGVWWLGFALITFKYLPKDVRLFTGANVFKKGFQEIIKVAKELMQKPNVGKFLLAFFFYSAGVQTIIYLATPYAEKVLNFKDAEMIIIVIVLQLVGIAGAYLFAALSNKVGNKNSIITMVFIWLFICIAAHFCTGKVLFYFIAAGVGMVMGGIQSVSRATYSKMVDDESPDVTSYFSFYDMLNKLAIVLGTMAFGIVDNITGNMRYSVLALAVFFVIALIILYATDFKKAMEKSVA